MMPMMSMMTIDPVQLLRKLEPAVRPASAPARIREGATPFERKGFDELLALVSAGALTDGPPVRTAPHVGLDEPLTPGQLDRLAAAANVAAGAGAERAVMLIDGRGLVLDVAARTITAELTDAAEHELVELDAAVYVASTDAGPRRAGAPPPPGTGLVPPGIAKYFESATN